MELACKSNEIFLADDIRSLSDNELDAVNGGFAHLAAGAAILIVWAISVHGAQTVIDYENSK